MKLISVHSYNRVCGQSISTTAATQHPSSSNNSHPKYTQTMHLKPQDAAEVCSVRWSWRSNDLASPLTPLPTKPHELHKNQQCCYTCCTAYASILHREAVPSSKLPVDFYPSNRSHIMYLFTLYSTTQRSPTHTHTHTHTHARTCAPAHANARAHACTHARVRARTRTRTHTHIPSLCASCTLHIT